MFRRCEDDDGEYPEWMQKQENIADEDGEIYPPYDYPPDTEPCL